MYCVSNFFSQYPNAFMLAEFDVVVYYSSLTVPCRPRPCRLSYHSINSWSDPVRFGNLQDRYTTYMCPLGTVEGDVSYNI